MVGGTVIEVMPMRLENGRAVIRLRCVNESEECAVYSEHYEPGAGPKVGDNISWQNAWIIFDGGRRTVRKVGLSFDPRLKYGACRHRWSFGPPPSNGHVVFSASDNRKLNADYAR